MHAEKSKKSKGRHKRTKGEKTKPAVQTSRAWSVWYGVCRRNGRTICKKTKSKVAAKKISTIVSCSENTLSLRRVFLLQLIKFGDKSDKRIELWLFESNCYDKSDIEVLSSLLLADISVT